MRTQFYSKISKQIRAQKMRNNTEILLNIFVMTTLWGIRHES